MRRVRKHTKTMKKVNPDKLRPIADCARYHPNRPSRHCMLRYARDGVVAADGTRILLQSVKLSGRSFCSKAFVEQFLAEQEAATERAQQQAAKNADQRVTQPTTRRTRPVRLSSIDEDRAAFAAS